MLTTEEILSVIAPALYADAKMATYIALAEGQTSSDFFGSNYTQAVALRAAHQWTLNTKRQGESGVITYKAEGRLMTSYGGTGVIRDELGLTNYGMQLKDLIYQCGLGASTTSYDVYTSYLTT